MACGLSDPFAHSHIYTSNTRTHTPTGTIILLRVLHRSQGPKRYYPFITMASFQDLGAWVGGWVGVKPFRIPGGYTYTVVVVGRPVWMHAYHARVCTYIYY
jgi:hypothetical protein